MNVWQQLENKNRLNCGRTAGNLFLFETEKASERNFAPATERNFPFTEHEEYTDGQSEKF